MDRIENTINFSPESVVESIITGLLILGQDKVMAKKVGISIATIQKALKISDKINARNGAPTQFGVEFSKQKCRILRILWEKMMKLNEQVYTTYIFDGNVMNVDDLRQKLEYLGLNHFGSGNISLLMEYPEDKGKYFDGLCVKVTDEHIEVALLHPSFDHESEYWKHFEDTLKLFQGFEPIKMYDWREGAKERYEEEQAKKEIFLSKGKFHVAASNCELQEENIVLYTNDPVEAYNAFVKIPKVNNGYDCRCKIQTVNRHYKRDEIMRRGGRISSFEINFFITPNMRRGETYQVGKYTYRRFIVYNLLTGKSKEECCVGHDDQRNTSLDYSIIADDELKIVRGGGKEYPIKPVIAYAG